MSEKIKAVIVNGPWKADMYWTPTDMLCMRRGRQALVYVYPEEKMENGKFYVLDYRYTIDAGPEVGIRQSDASGTDEYGEMQVFPYDHESGISRKALRQFIEEFDWETVYYTKK